MVSHLTKILIKKRKMVAETAVRKEQYYQINNRVFIYLKCPYLFQPSEVNLTTKVNWFNILLQVLRPSNSTYLYEVC